MPLPGEGRINCQVTAGRLHQTTESAYPLKIISPQAVPNANTDGHERNGGNLHPAVNYILSYGGGIVHGDRIHINVQVGRGCALLVLTQGSTKVFRHRRHNQPDVGSCSFLALKQSDSSRIDYNSNATTTTDQSYQTILIDVAPGSLACLLPDPVTCFEGAMYNQRQAVRLHDAQSSSLVLLDWMTSGRMSRGERWAFGKYFSVNVVSVLDNLKHKQRDSLSKIAVPAGSYDAGWINESRIIIRDALLLNSQENSDGGSGGHWPAVRSYSFAQRLELVDIFAYLLILGPAVANVADLFRNQHLDQRIKPFRPLNQQNSLEDEDEPGIAWSVSEVDELGVKGVAVRVAGLDTEYVKSWIKRRLVSLQCVIGDSAWSMYYNA
ncbi:hypothetical protein GGH99_006085 [Coemansia sp. RSA 1285]|nr:hypothetical protein EV177_008139 [Coemansia sp. RSA 1804]KAJ2672640.1 hypothetical protein GGH99_006085 [Coemansia sp. RSA 1285]